MSVRKKRIRSFAPQFDDLEVRQLLTVYVEIAGGGYIDGPYDKLHNNEQNRYTVTRYDDYGNPLAAPTPLVVTLDFTGTATYRNNPPYYSKEVFSVVGDPNSNFNGNSGGNGQDIASITIPANQASISFTVYPIDDGVENDSLYLTVMVHAGQNYTTTQAPYWPMTTFEYGTNTVSITDQNVKLYGPGQKEIITVTRTGSNTNWALVVTLSISGSAILGTDYSTVPAFSFAGGGISIYEHATSASFTLYEGNGDGHNSFKDVQFFVASITGPNGDLLYGIGSPSSVYIALENFPVMRLSAVAPASAVRATALVASLPSGGRSGLNAAVPIESPAVPHARTWGSFLSSRAAILVADRPVQGSPPTRGGSHWDRRRTAVQQERPR